MTADPRRVPIVAALVLALSVLMPIVAHAGGQESKDSLVPKAVAFVQTMAKGDFKGAEADFTDRMKQGLPPERLRQIWQGLTDHFGPFQDTGDSKTAAHGEYTIVIVRTDFKSRAIGIQLAFDSAQRIAGMYVVNPP